MEVRSDENLKKLIMQQEKSRSARKELQAMADLPHDQQSSMASTKKTVSSAADILSSFSHNSNVPLYRWLGACFLLTMLVCLGVSVGVSLYPSLAWNNSEFKNNPIIEWLGMYEINFGILES